MLLNILIIPYDPVVPSSHHHYKKNRLLWRAKSFAKAQKSAAKGTFDLQRRVLLRRFIPSMLQSRSRSIAAVTKRAVVYASFSSGFGLLWWAKNCRYITLEFGSIEFQRRVMCAAIGYQLKRTNCTCSSCQQARSATIGLHLKHNMCTFSSAF